MRIDCATCPARGRRCQGCMLTAFWQLPQLPAQGRPQVPPPQARAVPAERESSQVDRPRRGSGVPLDVAEQRAVAVFVAAGLLGRAEAATVRALPDARGQRARPA